MNDPKVVERIRKLESEHGEVTAEVVLRDARKKSSPLHPYFEWDDRLAAHEWRKEQARRLIREVRLVIHESETTVRRIGYVRDPDKEYHDPGYVSTVVLRNDKQRAREALVAELDRAEAALARAYDVADALDLTGEIESLRARLHGIRSAA